MSQPEAKPRPSLIETLRMDISDLLKKKRDWYYNPTKIFADEWDQILARYKDSLPSLQEDQYNDLLMLSFDKVERGGFSRTLSKFPNASINNVSEEQQQAILLTFAQEGRLHEIGSTDFIKHFLLKEAAKGSSDVINKILKRCLLGDEVGLIASPLDSSNPCWNELGIVCEIIDQNIPCDSQRGEGILGLVPVLLMCGLLTKDRLKYLLNAEKIELSNDFFDYIQDPIKVMGNLTKEDLERFPILTQDTYPRYGSFYHESSILRQMWELGYLKLNSENPYIRLSTDYFNFLASLEMKDVDFSYADLSECTVEIPPTSRRWPCGADLRGSTIKPTHPDFLLRSSDPNYEGCFRTFLRSRFDRKTTFQYEGIRVNETTFLNENNFTPENPFPLGKGLDYAFDDFKECINTWLKEGDVVQYLLASRQGTNFHGTPKTAWTGIQMVLGYLFMSGLAGTQRFYAPDIQKLVQEAHGNPHKPSLTPEERSTYAVGVWQNTKRPWRPLEIGWQDHSQEIFPILPQEYFNDAFTQALIIIGIKDPKLYETMIPEDLRSTLKARAITEELAKLCIAYLTHRDGNSL